MFKLKYKNIPKISNYIKNAELIKFNLFKQSNLNVKYFSVNNIGAKSTPLNFYETNFKIERPPENISFVKLHINKSIVILILVLLPKYLINSMQKI